MVGQAIIQVVMSVPNNNDLPQRHTQSKQPDHSISLEPRGAIHINDEPTDEIVDLSTPPDIDIDQPRNTETSGQICSTDDPAIGYCFKAAG